MQIKTYAATCCCPQHSSVSPPARWRTNYPTTSPRWSTAGPKPATRRPSDQKEAAFADLQDKAHAVSTQFAGHAEPLIWEGIIASSHAKYQGMFAAGKSAKLARDLLQAAQKIDANALDGSVYVSLGALYYKVPGWPLSFGDKKKASELLQQALEDRPERHRRELLLRRSAWPNAATGNRPSNF